MNNIVIQLGTGIFAYETTLTFVTGIQRGISVIINNYTDVCYKKHHEGTLDFDLKYLHHNFFKYVKTLLITQKDVIKSYANKISSEMKDGIHIFIAEKYVDSIKKEMKIAGDIQCGLPDLVQFIYAVLYTLFNDMIIHENNNYMTMNSVEKMASVQHAIRSVLYNLIYRKMVEIHK